MRRAFPLDPLQPEILF